MSSNFVSHDSDNLINIGQLKKPYGIKGWLWLFSETDNREDIFAMSPWFMKTAQGMKPLTVVKWRKQGTGLVAQFAEIPDRNLAETMNGVSIWVAKDNLPQPDEDDYFWSELVGFTVKTADGIVFGDIDKLFATGANDVMVVNATADSADEEQRLIPWHKSVVVSVTRETKTVIVDWQLDY